MNETLVNGLHCRAAMGCNCENRSSPYLPQVLRHSPLTEGNYIYKFAAFIYIRAPEIFARIGNEIISCTKGKEKNTTDS